VSSDTHELLAAVEDRINQEISDTSSDSSDDDDDDDDNEQNNDENNNGNINIPEIVNFLEENNLLGDEANGIGGDFDDPAFDEFREDIAAMGLGPAGADFDGLGNNIDNQDVGNEIRVALFELLGLEGAFHVMFRNAAWLLAFSSVYITSLGFLPYMIGRKMVKKLSERYLQYELFQLLDFMEFYEIASDIHEKSIQQNPPLRFMDLICIIAGYGTICSVVFFLGIVGYYLNKLISTGVIGGIAKTVTSLATVVKVGLLLVVRIFLIPVTLGKLFLHAIVI
jgi:hypothetical protein